MTDINNIVIMGRLVRDIELKYAPSGTACGNMSIAVNESKKIGDQWEDYTSYLEVRLWGKGAESMQPYLTKGKPVVVEGKLQQQRWVSSDGTKRSAVVIIASKLRLAGGNANNDNNADLPQEAAAAEFSEDIPF